MTALQLVTGNRDWAEVVPKKTPFAFATLPLEISTVGTVRPCTSRRRITLRLATRRRADGCRCGQTEVLSGA